MTATKANNNVTGESNPLLNGSRVCFYLSQSLLPSECDDEAAYVKQDAKAKSVCERKSCQPNVFVTYGDCKQLPFSYNSTTLLKVIVCT